MAVKQTSRPFASTLRFLEPRSQRLGKLPAEIPHPAPPQPFAGDMTAAAPLHRLRWLAKVASKPRAGTAAGATADIKVQASASALEAPTAAPAPTCTPRGNPLPATVHASLSAEQLGSGRIIIVGDVHGCLAELRELLALAEFQEGVDTLILVGDLVNKGPASAKVVAEARRLGAFAVRGNHDDAALAAYRALHAAGDAADKQLKGKYEWVRELTAEDAAWLAELPFTLSLPSRRVLVAHAGLLPGVPLHQQSLNDIYTMRDVIPAKLLADSGKAAAVVNPEGVAATNEPQAGGQAWSKAWTGPYHLFFGHDALRQLQRRTYATGLDTGCCYGFKLTASVLPPAPKKNLLAKVLAQLKPAKTTSPNVSPRARATAADRLFDDEPKAASQGVTLESLGAILLSVESKHTYERVIKY